MGRWCERGEGNKCGWEMGTREGGGVSLPVQDHRPPLNIITTSSTTNITVMQSSSLPLPCIHASPDYHRQGGEVGEGDEGNMRGGMGGLWGESADGEKGGWACEV